MLVLVILALAFGCPLQVASICDDVKSDCELRAVQVAGTLEDGNFLRHAIEQGQRGDCIHQEWMDDMRRYGVRQASFLIEYSWRHEVVTFKIKKITFLSSYYSHYDKGIGGEVLKQIRKSGLEAVLVTVVLERVKKSAFATRHKDQVLRDKFEANVLDDEALPVLDIIF
jgi:hypothetical protein